MEEEPEISDYNKKEQSNLQSLAKIQEFHKKEFEDMLINKVGDDENINCNP